MSIVVDRWRAGEAAVVVALLHLRGADSVHRAGDQILVLGGSRHTFSANIGTWCSSFGVVLVIGLVASIIATGNHRRRWRAFALGAGVVVVGNVVRIAATVLVGIRSGPGSIEGFHDGLAVWFAVVVVLVGFGLFAFELKPKFPSQ